MIFLRKSGHNIELIPPSNTPKTKTPDLLMDGVAWEMKCPRGSSANTLEHMIKNATKQSDSIIIDLGDSRLEESKALKIIRRRSRETRAIRRVKVVTKEKDLLDIKP